VSRPVILFPRITQPHHSIPSANTVLLVFHLDILLHLLPAIDLVLVLILLFPRYHCSPRRVSDYNRRLDFRLHTTMTTTAFYAKWCTVVMCVRAWICACAHPDLPLARQHCRVPPQPFSSSLRLKLTHCVVVVIICYIVIIIIM